MIGDNLNTIATAEDALAFAATIRAIRATVEAIEAEYKPHLDELAAETKEYRAERDGKTAPLTERADTLRKVLAEWLASDPDGNIKDGDRIVASLTRKAGKPVIDAAKVPDTYRSMQPDMGKINLALAAGKAVPGVTVPISTVLRVL